MHGQPRSFFMRSAILVAAILFATLASPSRICLAEGNAAIPTQPASTAPIPSVPFDEPELTFTAQEIKSWPLNPILGQGCRISPVMEFPQNSELNLFRATVNFTGSGSVEVCVIHSATDNLSLAMGKKEQQSPFRAVKTGREELFTTRLTGQRYVWLAVRPGKDAAISQVKFVMYHGDHTYLGHSAKVFPFEGSKLLYRMMSPRHFDPSKTYPLVVSISGSGGIGLDNVKNMEMVTFGRYLFLNHYLNPRLECYSIVPQIPPDNVVPAPYYPAGEMGKPTPFHPDWPTVNENGYYNRAVLGLVQSLLADKSLRIDPDRVYVVGFSYGGKACWEFLKSGRNVFAGAMCGAGWPIGPARSEPSGAMMPRLRQEVQRYRHIPVHIFVGNLDPMKFGSRAVYGEILAQGGTAFYTEFPNTDHPNASYKAWGDAKNVLWLFEQNRAKNPPAGADPFPGGVYPN
jgi:hypothetical protein